MQLLDGRLVYSARDLVGFALCRHLLAYEFAAARGELERPRYRDPALDRVAERGRQHEARFLAELRDRGHAVVEITPDGSIEDRAERLRQAAEATAEAIREGADVIYQATFFDGVRRGHADFLLRVQRSCGALPWSYEVWDTKLAREPKAGALIQVLFYDELLDGIQGASGERVHLVLGGSAREVRTFAVARYAAWFRRLRRRFEETIRSAEGLQLPTSPNPVEHCEICAWAERCQELRRASDHLSLVAGVKAPQRRRLVEAGITNRTSLAEADWERLQAAIPSRSHDGYRRLQRQAALQLEHERSGELRFELLELSTGDSSEPVLQGLLSLPEPSSADLFLDIEGDPFALDDGVEYLFGVYEPKPPANEPSYRAFWSIDGNDVVTRAAEQAAFERTMAFLYERFRQALREDGTTGLHIFHYGAYEPATLKRLAARYGSYERELDELLRAETFVDLLRVVRHSLLASVESYSIKRLEPFYGFRRTIDLRDAGASIVAFEEWLELERDTAARSDLRQRIETYNADDCRSAAHLRDWLEQLRSELEGQRGYRLPRPTPKRPDGGERTEADLDETAALFQELTRDLPADRTTWTDEQSARWLLGHLLSWHRREMRATWWRLFAYREMTPEEVVVDDVALGGLEFVRSEPSARGRMLFRYRFPSQEHRIEKGSTVRDPYTLEECTVTGLEELPGEGGEVVLTRRGDGAGKPHPVALVPFEHVDGRRLEKRLRKLARWVIDHGVSAPGPYRAARDLLLRRPPRSRHTSGTRIADSKEEVGAAALRNVVELEESYLAIQGPPGSGKTTLAGMLVAELAARGKRIGVTANSHEVITQLLAQAKEAAEERGIRIAIGQRTKNASKPELGWHDLAGAEGIRAVNEGRVHVAGGTVWFWASAGLEPVDYLFIDEAGQLSLANALVAAMAARNVVLLGDPQQLDQPLLAAHPPGTERSALAHILGEEATMPPQLGLFLATSRRLHPAICAFTSEQFYEGRLASADECERQRLEVDGLPPAGLVFVPVQHEGCGVSSREEAVVVADLVRRLTAEGASWVDAQGRRHALKEKHILVIAPYNWQVRTLRAHLPADVRVGTVDKFQGKEAPVVIYSMASSTTEDAPRGMEFLYNRNRLNVATSRARCLAVLVASPRLLDPECKSIREMELANGLARFAELAATLEL